MPAKGAGDHVVTYVTESRLEQVREPDSAAAQGRCAFLRGTPGACAGEGTGAGARASSAPGSSRRFASAAVRQLPLPLGGQAQVAVFWLFAGACAPRPLGWILQAAQPGGGGRPRIVRACRPRTYAAARNSARLYVRPLRRPARY